MSEAPSVFESADSRVRLGLRENWRQFALLILINAFVGGMVGIERTVVPLVGAEEFGITSTTIVVSFIVSFGVIKALANLVSGQLADAWGRKHVLVLGWLVGLPVPFMIMWAPSWGWVVAANALLGINQGLAWSMTVLMKVDLVGPKSRGLAVGLNEFAGYLAVGVTAFLTGYLASRYGLRPVPIYLGVGYAVLGALLSITLVRDTRQHVRLEAAAHYQQSTSMVYPSLIAAVSDASHPTWRARSLSVYRFWRDLGYAIGALSAGIIADIFGMAWAIESIAMLTFLSGTVVALAMREKTRGGPDVAQSIEPK